MKVLIWIVCYFVIALITTALKENGVILGGIPTVILWLLVFFPARRLCKFWDEHKASPRSKTTMQSTRFCKECGQRLLDNSKFCSKCGADTSNDDIIEQGNEKFCSVCGADVSHDKEYCHICYKKLNETDIKN
ncbi:MAG: zinc-ribbon domain-containing protein [Ruminococcaceae bacterium]|nr:zinc-ribbon domain-containing protein [Oscillospiraceae bacterium]